MLHQLIDPAFYKHLLFAPATITDWLAYLVACLGLLILVVPFVCIGALCFRFSPAFQTTLSAYCRGRIAWAWGCLFAIALCVGDLCFIVFGQHLPSLITAIPYYFIILLLMIGVIFHKAFVRKELRKIQEFSR